MLLVLYNENGIYVSDKEGIVVQISKKPLHKKVSFRMICNLSGPFRGFLSRHIKEDNWKVEDTINICLEKINHVLFYYEIYNRSN